MKYRKTDFGYVVRLQKGEDVFQGLVNFAESVKLGCGSVTGIGAIENVELGYYDAGAREYKNKVFHGEYELINLTGNISTVDSKPFLHSHVTISDMDCRTYAGHLFKGKIALAGEFVVVGNSDRITRAHDTETGLNLLDL